MKKKFLSLIIAVLSIVLLCGTCVTAFADEGVTGAETKPFFNYIQPGDFFTYDKTNNIYTAMSTNNNTPRLTSVDAVLQTGKDTYSDDTIKFSYQYVELYDSPLAPSDWFLYLAFRAMDESPVWASIYGTHLLFYENCMKLIVRFNSEQLVEVQANFDSLYDDDFNFVDTGYHEVEINIDDEAETVTVYRDKGTEKEVSLVANCRVDYNNRSYCVLDTKGCYSFSVRNCKVNLKDLYFFNSKSTEVDDEVARYEEYIKSEEEKNNNNNEKTDKKGCGSVVVSSSVASAFGLTTLGGIVLLKKKEK